MSQDLSKRLRLSDLEEFGPQDKPIFQKLKPDSPQISPELQNRIQYIDPSKELPRAIPGQEIDKVIKTSQTNQTGFLRFLSPTIPVYPKLRVQQSQTPKS